MKKVVFLLAICFCGYLIGLPEDMPQERLPMIKNNRVVDKNVSVGGACEQEKCLVIYVAPWCPSCKALTPMINDLVVELKGEGISTSIIVGNDSRKNIFEYAKRYDVPVLADINSRFYRVADIRGVPYFAVSNRAGKRIKDHSGGYYEVAKMRELLDI